MVVKPNTQWIRFDFGGALNLPSIGLRPTIRFHRGVQDWLSGGRDVELIHVKVSDSNWAGAIEFRFANYKFETEEKTRKYLEEGTLFELLSGFRVIAVGVITEVDRP